MKDEIVIFGLILVIIVLLQLEFEDYKKYCEERFVILNKSHTILSQDYAKIKTELEQKECYFDEILQKAREIANEPYKCYDVCWEKSTKFYNYFKDKYKLGYAYGLYDNKYAHAWIEVIIPIELTTGEMIPLEEYKEHYNFGYYGVPRQAQTKC